MRLDKYLVDNSMVQSRARAAELIKEGKVIVDRKVVSKASYEVDETSVVEVHADPFPYVGRGALKLVYALDRFRVEPVDKTCIDIGASTGGFTDVLLQRGASAVFAVDSGHGQLAERLRNDIRVTNLEGFNARDLSPETIGVSFALAVCDVSFISQTLLHQAIRSVLDEKGIFIGLVKPQFELTKSEISKGGIVKTASLRASAAIRVHDSLIENGFFVTGFCESPIKGGDGNTEYLICAEAAGGNGVITPEEIERTVFDEYRDPSKKR